MFNGMQSNKFIKSSIIFNCYFLFIAIPYHEARQHVNDLIKRKIIVGHNLDSDFELLNLKHDKNLIRDTAT
jgi:DNA polymerase III epsilon subunit-like protein